MSRKHSPSKDQIRNARESAAAPFWRRYADELQLAVGLVLLVALVFGQTATHDFLYYDDNIFVTENAVVQAGWTWPGVMYAFESFDQASWHPLTWLWHMTVVEFAGIEARAHHLANVALHAINALLLWLFLRSLTGAFWRSALVAAVFAVHPMHVEVVAWVAEAKEILATLFWLLTLLAWLRWVRGDARKWYGIALGLFVLGLLSKPTVITLPFLLLLLDYWPLNRLRSVADIRSRIVEKLPFFAFSLADGLVTYFGQQGAGAFQDLGYVPFATRLMTVPVNYAFYLYRTFWPTGLAVLYPFHGTVENWAVVTSLIVLLAITGFVLWKGRTHGYLVTGWFWFLGVIVPVSGLVYVGSAIHADRYSYFAHAGLALMLVWALHDALGKWRRSMAVRVAAGLVIAALSVRAWHQTGYWQNTDTLFRHTLAVTEKNAIANHVIGALLAKEQRYEEALPYIEAALQINPKHGQALTTLARIQYLRQEFPAALANLDRAISLTPNPANQYYNRGLVLLELKREEESVEAFQKAIDAGIEKSLRSISHFEIGRSYMRRNKPAEAIPYFEKALELDRAYLLARKNLAFALMDTNRNKEALGQFKIVAAQLPNDDDVKWALGQLTGTAPAGVAR